MTVYFVDDDLLHSQGAQDYYSRADSRVMVGLRFALEALDLPVPAYARRKPPGRPPAKLIAAAYSADHPYSVMQRPKESWADPLRERRLAAAVAKARAKGTKPGCCAETAETQ